MRNTLQPYEDRNGVNRPLFAFVYLKVSGSNSTSHPPAQRGGFFYAINQHTTQGGTQS